MKKRYLYLFFLLLTLCQGRKHKLRIRDDKRSYISLTSFGLNQGGYLNVTLESFIFQSPQNDAVFGFTLEKILNNAADQHMETFAQRKCLLKDEDKFRNPEDDIIYFVMNLKDKLLKINCGNRSSVANLSIYENPKSLPVSFSSEMSPQQPSQSDSEGASCVKLNLHNMQNEKNRYKTQFAVYVPTKHEEGLYELFFHSCPNYEGDTSTSYSFDMNIVEHNVASYLSAGDMPLPALYFMMSIMFFLAALFWMYILVKSRHPVFKIHYLMGALMILKSMALLFHGINYHYIAMIGEHEPTWAVLYYVTHLLKGLVLFITILLIGTGWIFVKHILSPKDKRVFMIVIPLQVFANVAEIIINESEEGDSKHRMWIDVFTFVDLICCFAILFPIVWSIKHLQDASHTDGKAAINLRKLKLFRHFYIVIVFYIYFSRIIMYLIRMTVPFQYTWVDEMFKEIATFLFFVLTGYKFRPASENPYFYVPEEDENDMEVVFSQCGFTEGLTKLNRISNETGDDDQDTLLVSKRESSHDYD